MNTTKTGTTAAKVTKVTKLNSVSTEKSKTISATKPETKKAEVTKEATQMNLVSLPRMNRDLFLKTTRGGNLNHESMFKEEITKGMDKKAKRLLTRTIRKEIKDFAKTLAYHKSENHVAELRQLKKEFMEYYHQVFKLNDLSLKSIAGGNVKGDRKEELEAMLATIKAIKL